MDHQQYTSSQLALEQHRDALSAEFNPFVQGSALFKSFMQSVSDTFKFAGDLYSTDTIKEFTSEQKKFIKLMNATSYSSLTGIAVSIPEGMHGTYLDYAKTLMHMTGHIKNIEKETIDPYIFHLAQLVGDKAAATTIHRDSVSTAKISKLREDLYKEVTKHFSKSSYVASSKFGDVIHRNADWEALFKTLHALISDIESVNRDRLKSKIAQGTDYINIIIDQYSKEDSNRLSKEAAQKLGDYTYSVAKELEMYSDVHYRILTLNESVKSAMEKTSEIFG